jgi:transcription elongation factor GreA
VKLTGFVPGEEEVFHLVPEQQADVLNNRIPPSSPLANALVGRRAGERLSFHSPGGAVEIVVLEVGTD